MAGAGANNYAFIDAQNVHMGTKGAGWTIDVFRLRRYLREKYGVAIAFWFVGYLPEMRPFYTVLQNAGFIVIFKEVGRDRDGVPKGNVDVDLTLHAVDLKGEYDQAVILTSDGDFASLVSYLRERKKLRAVLSPTRTYTSKLLRRAVGSSVTLRYLDDVREKIERKAGPQNK
jgi:uncharacterized LabA/DUF88 family protein